MKTRRKRLGRWLVLVGMSGALPSFFLSCDKAALNFQRGLFLGLGSEAAAFVFDEAGNLIPQVGS